MVLARGVKRAGYLLCGALLGLLAGAIALALFNHWYTAAYVRSDDDSNVLVGLVLIGLPLAVLAGAALGAWRYRRNEARRS